jgi:chitodextrinase
VPGTQPKVPIEFDYADESDPGPYPIPPNPLIEGGPDSDGDRHVLVLDEDNCTLYETFYALPQPDGSWQAGSGAVFDLRSNDLRERDWTSADAAGLPILAGLVRYDEVAAGEIRHAIRFTAPQTRKEYIWPARHYASSLTGTNYPPMGQRFRLKASFDISQFSPQVQVILQALKKYGMILADNGSSWFISGAPDSQWNDDMLVNELKLVKGSDFEAVDESSLMVDPDSGQVNSTPSESDTLPPSTPTNLVGTALSSSQINLSWNPSSDNVGVTGYRVIRNGIQIGTTANPSSYGDTGLSPARTYRYSVAAYDAAGNASMVSRAVSARTQPLPSTKFAIGNRVRVTWKANVYSAPSTSGTVLGAQLKGVLGTVTGGPWYANFRWWWRVDFDTGSDGWLDQSRLAIQ